jgi:hypothetical protein
MCRYSVHEITTHGYQGTNSVTQQTSLGLFSIATAAKRSRVGAFVCVVAIFPFSTYTLAAPANSQPAATINGPAIYKLVDASGRITYTNSPTKGATKVELDPITVIPSSPAGMLGGGQAGAQANVSPNALSATAPELIPVGIAPTIAKPEAPTMPLMPVASPSIQATQPTFAASARVPNVQPATAVVTPVSAVTAPRAQSPLARDAEQSAGRIVEAPAAPAYKLPVVKLSPRDAAPGDIGIRPVADTPLVPAVTPPTTNLAPNLAAPVLAAQPTLAPPSPVTVAVASTREMELPQVQVKPSVQSTLPAPKFEKEEQLLASLKAQLAEQQNASASFRAMRARLPAIIDQSDPAKAAIQNDIKAQVEQHFERIRSLQDQIGQREQNLAALRQ